MHQFYRDVFVYHALSINVEIHVQHDLDLNPQTLFFPSQLKLNHSRRISTLLIQPTTQSILDPRRFASSHYYVW
jgi:hypothetical protein